MFGEIGTLDFPVLGNPRRVLDEHHRLGGGFEGAAGFLHAGPHLVEADAGLFGEVHGLDANGAVVQGLTAGDGDQAADDLGAGELGVLLRHVRERQFPAAPELRVIGDAPIGGGPVLRRDHLVFEPVVGVGEAGHHHQGRGRRRLDQGRRVTLVIFGLGFSHLAVVVQAADQEERLDDVLHGAAGFLQRRPRLVQRRVDLAGDVRRRRRAGHGILAAAPRDEDEIADGDALGELRVFLGHVRVDEAGAFPKCRLMADCPVHGGSP